jgi:UTP:GlnB (protein PII) uridylyltransferase
LRSVLIFYYFKRYHNIEELETKSNSFEQLKDLYQKKIISENEKKEFEYILNLSFSVRIALHLLHNCEQDENKHYQGKSLKISNKLIFSMDLILTKILDFICSFWRNLKILNNELSSIEILRENRHLSIQKWIENKLKESFILMKNLLSTGYFIFYILYYLFLFFLLLKVILKELIKKEESYRG